MYIEKFVPPSFTRHELNIDLLRKTTGKNFEYAAKGRYAIEHIIRSFESQDNRKGGILLPVYVCESVLDTVKKCNIDYYFYDLDESDLNADLESIIKRHRETNAKYLLVASLYGNPANLADIERYCCETGLILIDDAAQSFGSLLNERYVGTFGNAGLFSFSPGKSTAAHMGAFYWKDVNVPTPLQECRKKHLLTHLVMFWDFYFNRLHVYRYKPYRIFSALNYLARGMNKCFDLSYDTYNKFEESVLGGVLYSLFNEKFKFRKIYFTEFIEKYKESEYFDSIQAQRGKPEPHKIVIKAKTENIASEIKLCLKNSRIYYSEGYKLLADDLSLLPHAANINNKIIEIPIENDVVKMEYLFQVMNKYR